MTTEERLDKLEKRNKRLTAAVTLMAVAICGVVAIGAKGQSEQFSSISAENITAEYINVKSLSISEQEGYARLNITTDKNSNGLIKVFNNSMEHVAKIGTNDNGDGEIGVWYRTGKGKGNLLTPQP